MSDNRPVVAVVGRPNVGKSEDLMLENQHYLIN